MINAKNELQYLLILKAMEEAEKAGKITADELDAVRGLSVKMYGPVVLRE